MTPRGPRLAIFDNMVNNAFIQAKAFHRRGHAIDLVLDPTDRFVMSDPRWEELDFEVRPEQVGDDSADVLPPWRDEPGWIRRGPDVRSRPLAIAAAAAGGGVRAPRQAWRAGRLGGPYGAALASIQRWTIRTLREYDAVLAYGAGAIYATLAGVPCVAQTWGGDITIVPFGDGAPGDRGELPEPEQSARRPRFDAVALARLQRWALARAHRVLLTDPRFIPYAERLGLGDRAVFLPFVVDTGKYAPAPELALRQELLGDGRTLLFVPSRLDFHWKGSGAMLEGVARAMGEDDGIRLACAGWGADHARAVERARELGIVERVTFLPNVFSKTRLVRYYRACDVILDQFSIGSYGAAGLEAMSMGRPLLIHLDPERFDRVFGVPPVVNVREPAEIAAALVRLARDPAERERVGSAQREWVIRHQGDHLADEAHGLLLDAVAARPRAVA